MTAEEKKMTRESAKEIIARMMDNETYDDRVPSVHDFLKAKGFLEALQCKEVKDLVEALKEVKSGYEAEKDSSFEWIDWYEKAKAAISQWEKAVGEK